LQHGISFTLNRNNPLSLKLWKDQITEAMPNKFFKPRRPLTLSPHKYDLGIFSGLKEGTEDNHFLAKLWKMPGEQYVAYYNYHLSYFLNKEPEGEKEFFTYVWRITLIRIQFLEKENPFSSDHAKNGERLYILLQFQKYLRSIDQWHTEKTQVEVIAGQTEEIKKLKNQIDGIKEELKAARKLETEYHINIAEGQLLTVVDLFKKMEDLKIEGKELVFAQFQIIWAKMICRYFRHGSKEINFDTVRRYFPGDKENPGVRSASVPAKNQLYNIVPIKKRG
jgi:hypothetical protein